MRTSRVLRSFVGLAALVAVFLAGSATARPFQTRPTFDGKVAVFGSLHNHSALSDDTVEAERPQLAPLTGLEYARTHGFPVRQTHAKAAPGGRRFPRRSPTVVGCHLPHPLGCPIPQVLELLTEHGFERMDSAMQLLINEAMQLERAEFLQAGPHERTGTRRGWANGFGAKRVATRAGEIELRIPQVRGLPDGAEGFYPKSLERGVRSERALKLAVAEVYVQGVSTRRVAQITRELCGLDISSAQVPRATEALDEELKPWRERPLGRGEYLILDARYEKVRHGGSVVICAVLSAIGVREDGRRSILGVSVKLSEAEVHWREFLAAVQERGLHGVKLVSSDSHEGLKAALQSRMSGVPWQRCQFHLQRNAMAYVPRTSMRREVADALRVVFNAPDRIEADRRLGLAVRSYRETAPALAEWMEHNVPESLSVLALPTSHRRLLRATNPLERLDLEMKRRTRVATLFPNEASLLRLVSAVLAEIGDEWELVEGEKDENHFAQINLAFGPSSHGFARRSLELLESG